MARSTPSTARSAVIIGVAVTGMAVLSNVTGYASFLNLDGLAIVIGGSVANAFLSFRRDNVRKAFDCIAGMLKKTQDGHDRLHQDIRQLIQWSYLVQMQDLMGLEKEAANTDDESLLRYGIDLVVTGYPAYKIREMMQTATEAEFERRIAPVTVLRNMAATAPSFGMVGTLIGMVVLLNHLGGDIAGIGGGLAIAMLSTLYGILLARLVCLPAADKLLQREEDEHFRYGMITEGLALLAEKEKPFYVQDRLNSFLEPSKHIDFDHYIHSASRRQFAAAA